MSDENSEAQGYGQEEEAREPSPDLKRLDRLVGTWEISGDTGGTVTYEWMEGASSSSSTSTSDRRPRAWRSSATSGRWGASPART